LLKTRVISATVGIAILVAVLLLGRLTFGVAITVVALIAMYEFYNAVSNTGLRPVKWLGYLSCILLLGVVFIPSLTVTTEVVFLFAFIVLFILFFLSIFWHDRYTINDISITVLGIAYVAFLFMFVILARNMENGLLMIIFVFLGAYSTDTFAYFCGMFFGKRKFLPKISPKKTLEGTIGGFLGTILVTIAYGVFVLNAKTGSSIPVYHYIILGALIGIISQLGDWAASSVKRYVNIKDYGNIMPGHGGALDRFDSVLFVAPVIYFYFTIVLK